MSEKEMMKQSEYLNGAQVLPNQKMSKISDLRHWKNLHASYQFSIDWLEKENISL